MPWNQDKNKIQESTHPNQIVDFFSDKWNKEILLDSDLNYLIISNSPDIDISINTSSENVKSKIFWIFYSDSTLPTRAKIEVNLQNDNTETEIYLLSITREGQSISVDGSINMANWVKKVSWTLLEENLVFWNNVSIKTKPVLNIYSNDVKASHGARIEKIDAEKLFYLTSKWISWSGAETLILDWHIDFVLSHFDSVDQEAIKSKIIRK